MTPILNRRRLGLAALLLALAAATGCAGIPTVDSDIASFGEWPAGRAPGRYAFERLPSQQADAKRQAQLEAAAAPALALAGFQPAAEGAQPDIIVQLGARIDSNERSPWDDPFWWRSSWRGRFITPAPWWGPGWRGAWPPYDHTRYDREVALLLRDATSGQPLFEAHASSSGMSPGNDALLSAMYAASLDGFPKAQAARQVRTGITATPAAPAASAP